jgi:hypothetical protein
MHPGQAWRRRRVIGPLRSGSLAAGIFVVLALGFPAGAPAQTSPTGVLYLTESEAIAIASRDAKVQETTERYGRLTPRASLPYAATWQVDFFAPGLEDEYIPGAKDVAQVLVDDRTGAVSESWTGYQVRWILARGYPGKLVTRLNAPYVWIPLAALFFFGLLDWRRPWRVAHLDLLVLLSFGVSNYFLNRAEVGVSVPLVYPPLIYLMVRMLWIGFRGARAARDRAPRGLRPTVPIVWLVVAAAFLLSFRIALSLGDPGGVDVGYAGVVGADRLTNGQQLWGDGTFPSDNPNGDTYGPVTYLAYVPFELAWPWAGTWDELPAARAAAIFFDLATVAGLFVLGGRLRPGRRGREVGVILAFAWLAFPYTDFVLQAYSNDALMSALLIWSLVLFARPVARGALLALATLTKFAPLMLAPLFATGERSLLDDERRGPEATQDRLLPVAYFTATFMAVSALMLLYPAIDSGLATFYDRSVGFQFDRSSPFSIWGQEAGLEWLRDIIRALSISLVILVAFVPARRTLAQIAALSAAILIAVQLPVEHWFYFYIPWFLPLVIAALVAIDPPEGSSVPRLRSADPRNRAARG